MSLWDVTVSWRLCGREVMSVFFVYFGRWSAVPATSGTCRILFRFAAFFSLASLLFQAFIAPLWMSVVPVEHEYR